MREDVQAGYAYGRAAGLAAGNDVLLDDSLAFAARAARPGVPVDLRVRPDAASLAADALPAMAAFIADSMTDAAPVTQARPHS